VNRINALVHAYEDGTRPATERDAALAALRSLITDGSDPAERQQAQVAVKSLEGNRPEYTPCPLENELLYEYHAATLADVQYHDIHEFCVSHKLSADSDKLYMKWLSVSPVARKKMQQMRKHFENYFLESYDSLLTRYKSGLDSGGDMSALNKEALEFYRDWLDSGIIPEELQPEIRQLIVALSAHTEGHHDNQNQ
jgi:hypothetical protein